MTGNASYPTDTVSDPSKLDFAPIISPLQSSGEKRSADEYIYQQAVKRIREDHEGESEQRELNRLPVRVAADQCSTD